MISLRLQHMDVDVGTEALDPFQVLLLEPVRKSTSELIFVNLHAIEQAQLRRQNGVDGAGRREI